MLTEFVDSAGTYLQTNPWLAVVAVFVGGLLTASNPCCLAMIPLMVSFVAGRKDGTVGVLPALGLSLVFVVGLSVAFTTLGMIAALAGKLYGDVSVVWTWLVAAVCLVMGLHMTDLVKVPIPGLKTTPRVRGPLGALILGLLFGLVSAPCAAPVLVVLLTYLAGSGASVPFGGLLLFVYGLGHSALVLVAGTSMGAAQTLIASRGWTAATTWLRRAAGVVIVLVGAYFVYEGVVK